MFNLIEFHVFFSMQKLLFKIKIIRKYISEFDQFSP